MKGKEEEYREIFLADAQRSVEELNRLLTVLEKNSQDRDAVNALFRITHTLKGNAAGMGFMPIMEMAHVLEDFFSEVRGGRIVLNADIFAAVFKGADSLSALVNSIRTNRAVRYKGIKTKLELLIKHTAQLTSGGSNSLVEQSGVENQNSPFVPEAILDSGQPDETEAPQSSGEVGANFSSSDLVQVPVWKLDNLLDLVGELIIEKDRILAAHSGLHGSNEYGRLSRISSDLQYSVMDVRLVQVGFLFNKFHRVVRDAAILENKNVTLKLEGADTEIDRNVLQVISDSLIHLIRNAVGHGVETPEERKKQRKPDDGTLWLCARNEMDSVIIEIKDDGKGLDYERIRSKAISNGLISTENAALLSEDELSMLIFEPGFSTADQITAISGRGVGMDVVKKTIDSIGGLVNMKSEKGKGTSIQLTLPSSLAVKACLLFNLRDEIYAMPLAYTESVISLYKSDIYKAGGGLIACHLGKNISIIFLKDIFNYSTTSDGTNIFQRSIDEIHPEQRLEIVVVKFNNRVVGFVVDKLLQQKEIIEKPLKKPIDQVKFMSGVTILGSGKVCPVLNIPYILNFIFNLPSVTKPTKNFSLN
jgi:two-component system chemotaxis sensor kinase CheA